MITREDLQPIPLLAELPPEQLDAIAARAADLNLQPGDWLIREGEQAAFSIAAEEAYGERKEDNVVSLPRGCAIPTIPGIGSRRHGSRGYTIAPVATGSATTIPSLCAPKSITCESRAWVAS